MFRPSFAKLNFRVGALFPGPGRAAVAVLVTVARALGVVVLGHAAGHATAPGRGRRLVEREAARGAQLTGTRDQDPAAVLPDRRRTGEVSIDFLR